MAPSQRMQALAHRSPRARSPHAPSALAPAAQARITKLEIQGTESPTSNGQSFGAAGQYERIYGRAYGELSPNDPHNEIITDLKLAPRNSRGMVEYNMTFSLEKPIDMSKSNGVLFYFGREPRQRRRDAQRGRPRLDRRRMAGRRHADRAQPDDAAAHRQEPRRLAHQRPVRHALDET